MTKAISETTNIDALMRISRDLNARKAARETTVDPVVEMGQRIAALIEETRRLDKLEREARRDGNPARCSQLSHAGLGAQHQLDMAKGYALSLPAGTLAGAAIQLMLAFDANWRLLDVLETEGSAVCREDCAQVDRAIESALKVVAAAANLDLKAIGGEHFLPPRWFPESDLVAAE